MKSAVFPPFASSLPRFLALLAVFLLVPRVPAQVTVPPGAPAWARTATNLEFRPIVGTTRVAYVDPLSGDDGTGQVDTFDAGDVLTWRENPDGVNTFATGDAAIAAVAVAANGQAYLRDGPHAVLFANSGSGAVHTAPVTAGGCRGLSAAHPWYFGPYFPSAPAATVYENMAMFDPGIGAHPSADAMFRVQRNGDDATPPNGGFDYLVIEGFIFRQAHRVWGDAAYSEPDAVETDNDWAPLKVYGKGDSVLVRNCVAHSTAEGFAFEGIGNADGSRLTNLVLDRVVSLDVWSTHDRNEGLFLAHCERPRLLNSAVVGGGWFRHDPAIDEGNEGTGTNQGVYFAHVKDPWVDNTIAALNSHAGLQVRCGGSVTRSLLYANTRNVSFGHGQNEMELNRWPYDAVVRDVLVWGSKDPGDESGLALGGGLEWGRCRSADFQRFVIVGDPTYRSTADTFGLNLGLGVSGMSTSVRIGPGVVYDWNPSGVSSTGSLGWQEASASNATVTITGLRLFEQRGKMVYAQGTEATTRARISAAAFLACRNDKSGTAADYGPSGTTPASLSAGKVDGYVKRPTWSGATAPALWTLLGFADEEAMLTAWTTPGTGWDARRVINRVFPEFGFGALAAQRTTAANVSVVAN